LDHLINVPPAIQDWRRRWSCRDQTAS